jgi:tetratricopeptide (TPR) repeat protein
MNTGSLRRTRSVVVLLVALVGFGAPATAAGAPMQAGPSADAIATLEAASGRVSVIRLGQSETLSASMPLLLNDIILTREGRATIRFRSDGSVVRIGPDSRVQVDERAKERDITVFFGRIWAHVVRFKERTTRFRTGSTIAAIRGTELNVGVAVDGDETQVSVLEGQVVAETDAGNLALQGGQVAVAKKGIAPALAVQVRPLDAVRWALYYLPVLPGRPGEPGVDDLGLALDQVEATSPASASDPRYFTRRASLMLAAGKIQEAERDIQQALSLAGNDGDALALQAIVAVASSDGERALQAARKAVAADPKSASAQIALSYALQAGFDLEGARQSLEAAVGLAPQAALAWARLAEIRSSLGNRAGALEAAVKSAALDPQLSRAQTVLGYAYLAQVRTREAREAFGKALELDRNDPLPWLGQGLARIREGDLDAGIRDLEVAVSLDPGQAVVRSYLGKGYYEAKRAALDEREFDLARQADPKDPTPLLYGAIAKQTTNRPVEALRNIQQAIELNDNRAVYRSRLLLDQDLASRSASLGRIYSDLGFQSLALVEGWNSVNTDPGNYSAHRLLADAYAARPRHEIARVSELLQSQMLQPLNTTPIQPSLGESSLFLISSQGPGVLSFNEFNPLFNRDQVNVQGSFVAGQDATWSGEGIVSGIYKKASFSAGYSDFQTDGFRLNAGQDDRIANAFAQLELSPSTSVQGEFRHRNRESGDLELRFLEDDFSPLQAEKNEGNSARVGLRQEFGPAVTALASYIHSRKDVAFALPNPDFGESFSQDVRERSDSVEGQLLFRSASFKVVAGGGYFDIDSGETSIFDFADPFDPSFSFTDITTGDRKIEHTNLYAYSYVGLPAGFTLTLGVSGDLFREDGRFFSEFRIPDFPPEEPIPLEPAPVLGEKNQANPKLGITWTGKSGTTLRAAGFRTLKRTLITDQTLEPTQVAGFNQFFDDPSATGSWVYGGAIDQKFGNRAFAGAEYMRRELTIPSLLFEDGVNLVLRELDGSEHLARAYLFAAPHEMLSLGAEYQYEKLERDPDLFLTFQTVRTHRVPLSVRFFHPSGVGALVGTTYLNQQGEFKRPGEPAVPGSRDFWVVDAALRYRLPQRYGFVVVGVNNLTDERSSYEATDSRNLSIRPGRVVFARLVLAFP